MDPGFGGAHGNLAVTSSPICIKEWLEELKRAAELAGAGNEELAEMKRAYRQGGIRQSPGFN